jgi:hypothetical protein
MNSRAPSRRGAAPAARPRFAWGSAARPKSGPLRRIGRIALYGAIGFLIASIVLVALYRVLPPPGTPLMLIRRVEGYGIDKSWRRLDDISPHLIRAAMAGEDARFCRHHGFDWGAERSVGRINELHHHDRGLTGAAGERETEHFCECSGKMGPSRWGVVKTPPSLANSAQILEIGRWRR